MRNLLIIYPHWPPSNLAGVHRPRLIANFLKDFEWKVIVLTVDADYYEETQDLDLRQTATPEVEVIYTPAYKVMKSRIVGDIGIRAFSFLYKKALEIISSRQIDFIWIPIPSFYTALLGRLINAKTKVPYGIDYIDPWVRDISTRRDWRHRLSNRFAKILEPIAVKKASIITGVSYEYYKPVLERNFKKSEREEVKGDRPQGSREWTSQKTGNEILKEEKNTADFKNTAGSLLKTLNSPLPTPHSPFTIHHAAFPYGFDPNDHKIKLDKIQYPWPGEEKVKPWIYAGAFLPNSHLFVEEMFKAVAELIASGDWDEQVKLYFIGTGAYAGKTILEYAMEAGIADMVFEDRSRYPYLHVLNFLSAADTVMVVGSTEKHYTASKVYQSLLSERPVWAIFHKESSAVQVMEECKADQYLVRYREGMEKEGLRQVIKQSLCLRLKAERWNPDLKALDKYSARESARKLVEGMEVALSTSSRPKGEI